MHQLFTCLTLGSLCALVVSGPVPVIEQNLPETIYLEPSSSAAPVSTSLDPTSSTYEGVYPVYAPPFVASTSVIAPISTGNPSGSSDAPLGTSAPSGSVIGPYSTVSVPPYVNISTAEPIPIYSYGSTLASGVSGIIPSPSSTVESTTRVTISATSTFTSTLSQTNGSTIDPTAVSPSANLTYPTPGIPSGSSTLGGITASSISSGGFPSYGYTGLSPISPISTLSPSGTGYVSGSFSTGTGVSGIATYSNSSVSSTALPPYPYTSNITNPTGTAGVGPTFISSGTLTSSSALPPYPYPSGISSSSTGGTAVSVGYPTPTNSTTDLSATEISSSYSPIDTTCTETLTSTLADGGTTQQATTFVTTTWPSGSGYPPVSINSTSEASPLTTSGSSVGTIPILTTYPVITPTDPVYPYPTFSPPVPTEYYYHHRRPHHAKNSFPYWFGGEGEDESTGGYGYDDPEDYDYDYDYNYEGGDVNAK